MNDLKKLKVGSRGSLLARTQSKWVIDRIVEANPGLEAELTIVRTTGDIHSQQGVMQPLSKGLFTKELEDALLAGEIDIAIHSLKDLPTELPPGMELRAVTAREDPRDVLIGKTLAEIAKDPEGITIGTGSLRRAAQMRARYPGCHVSGLQGNVDTRLRKVDQGIVDCAVMAAAGLKRVDLGEAITAYLDPDDMLPAPAQGALGIESRSGDDRVGAILDTVHCSDTFACVSAERAFLHRLESGCRAPVAALATIEGDILKLRGRVISVDGTQLFDGEISSKPGDTVSLGYRLADRLLGEGAREVLQAVLEETE